MSDFLGIILARVDPATARALEPVLDGLRAEFGGGEVYIASPRGSRAREIRAALRVESVSRVAERYRISRRTAQRLQRREDIL
jgi:hypothetical protein